MFTRIYHSAAVAGIAGGLIFLPVATASADGALNLVQEAAQTGLKLVASDGELVGGGALVAAAPEATLACVGPQVAVCAAVGVAVAGAVLYATKDTWMPWLENGFGVGGSQSAPDTTRTGSAMVLGLTVDGSPGGVWTLTESNTDGARSLGSLTGISIQCKVSGVVAGATFRVQDFYMGPGASQSTGGQCPALGEIVSVQSSYVYSADSRQINGTTNQVSWGVPFNPSTNSTVTSTVDCVKPDGTTGQVSVATINPDGGVLVPSCVAAFGPGSHGTKLALNGGQTGAAPQPLSTISVPTTSALYPNCVGAGVACTYVVSFKGTPCVVGSPDCVDWAFKAQADGNSDYTCSYGPYMIPLAGCAIDERAYESSPHRLSKLNTDGNPLTWDGPRPSWVTDPNANGDPSKPLPGAVPIAPPAGAPGGAPAKIPTAGDMPSPDPAAPHGAPNESTDCWPSGGAGWNPAEWVLRPVKCALTWAFVPSSVFMNGWSDGIKGEWASSPFGQWLAPLSGFGTLHIASGGCEGPALPTGFLGEGLSNGSFHVASPAVLPAVLHPFSACADPMAGVARTSNMILTAGIAFYGGMKVVRQLGYAFGFQIHVGSERSTFT